MAIGHVVEYLKAAIAMTWVYILQGYLLVGSADCNLFQMGCFVVGHVALLWQRDRATRLSVEILQLTKHPI